MGLCGLGVECASCGDIFICGFSAKCVEDILHVHSSHGRFAKYILICLVCAH